MRKITLALALIFTTTNFFTQKNQKDFPYQFEDVYKVYTSETKNQCRTGTCWSFATTSFIESEIFRLGHGMHDISEMYNVRMTYPKKAETYFRYHGKHQFSAGSLAHDVINSIAEHGIVPEKLYRGRSEQLEDYNHGEMDRVLTAMMDAIIKYGKPTDKWKDAVDGVLDAYMGEVPEKISYENKMLTPQEFRDLFEIKPKEYVSMSSFTHHPFYEKFILEVPDNFSQGQFYNVPYKDLTATVKSALKQGFTVAWDADVSEQGFSFKNGMAILPADKDKKRADLFKEKETEMTVTQELRQEYFDNLKTTDDHLMQIVGMTKDQDGDEYFVIKNSWGDENPYGGLQYVSIPYFEMKTISILVHYEAIPKDIQKSMKLDIAAMTSDSK